MGRATGTVRGTQSEPPHNSVTVQNNSPCLAETFDKVKVHVHFGFACKKGECCEYTWYIKNVTDNVIIDSGACAKCDEPYTCPGEKNYELGIEHHGDNLEANITVTSGTNDKELTLRLSINNFYT
jgi:hypothetical protein